MVEIQSPAQYDVKTNAEIDAADDHIDLISDTETMDASDGVDGESRSNKLTLNSKLEMYSPQELLKTVGEDGNPDILRELNLIDPVSIHSPMPELLEVFKRFPQYTYFPAVDDDYKPVGIIREVNLKRFVYSRFGSTLLENPVLKDKLTQFLEPCTVVDIRFKIEEVLKTYSESGTTEEGVIVTTDEKYLGVISLRSLIKLGHERELKLQETHARILEQKNNDINNILENMSQGIFTILEDGTIHHDYSAFLETILETDDIEGKHYFDLLFSNTNIPKDKLSQIRGLIENTIGEDILSYEVNSHLMVNEYQMFFDNKQSKHIELFLNPVVDANDTVTRFVVNIRDRTEIVALQQEADQQKKEALIVSQIFSITHDTFSDFIEASNAYLESCLQQLEKQNSFDSETIATLFRHLHTIKGNSRLYGFDDLTDVVHDVEAEVTKVRSREIAYDNKRLEKEVLRVKAVLDIYTRVVEKKLSGFMDTRSRGIFLDEQLYNTLSNTILNHESNQVLDSIQSIVKAQKVLSAVNTVSLNGIFYEINRSLGSMAKIVDRPKPNMYVNNNNIRVSKEVSSVLNIAIMHSARNSLSHGIERASDRVKMGKTEKGNIYIVAKLNDNGFTIDFWDDGAGLDLNKIRKKAIDAGMIKQNKPLGERQIAEFIFAPGLSTASNVTEIAGRGVGMDAIRKSLKDVGGSVRIAFTDKSKNRGKNKPFKFVFELPVDCAVTLE